MLVKEILHKSLLTCLCFLVYIPFQTFSASAENLEIKLYEVDDRNSVQRILETQSNKDVTLDGVSRIRLECTAPFPVQWIYSGNGVPALSSTIKKETAQKYSASAFITSLKESHTGRYECVSTANPTISAYLFLYVPGKNIFTVSGLPDGRRRIYVSKSDTKVVIPCSVSNSAISAVLEKLIEKNVLVAIKSPQSTYDPRVGFTLDIEKIQNPEGTYACTAVSKGSEKTIEFDVTFASGSSKSNYDLHSSTHEPITDAVGTRCSTHTDCPTNWACYTDLICRDPCLNSIRCGTGSVCKYRDRQPYCECPKDFVGDPIKECFSTLQGFERRPEHIPRPTFQPSPETQTSKYPTGSQCKVNDHCPLTDICLNGNCLDACAVKICHRNAYCVTDARRTAKCVCNPGFATLNGHDCIPEKLQLLPIQAQIQGDAPSSSASATRPVSSCQYNRDCPVDTVCRKEATGAGNCAAFCESRICGINANCDEGRCTCKPNFVGDPHEICHEQLFRAIEPTKNLGQCSTNDDCPSNQKCETLSGNLQKCVDACLTFRCQFNLECRAAGHKPECICPEGFTGSSSIGCTKTLVAVDGFKRQRTPSPLGKLRDVKLEATTQTVTSEPSCSSLRLNCGPNSECRTFADEPTCFCQSGFVGKPPNCKLECMFNIECPEHQSCVQNKCLCVNKRCRKK